MNSNIALINSYNFSLPFYKIIVPTIDTLRYDFLVSKLLANQYPVLLCGQVGSGKSSTAVSVLDALNPSKYSLLQINMSAQVSSPQLSTPTFLIQQKLYFRQLQITSKKQLKVEQRNVQKVFMYQLVEKQ